MENKICSFGIAGNFTGHLEQAGEAKDFLQVKTLDSNAPKAIFPTYLPAGNLTKGTGINVLFMSRLIYQPAPAVAKQCIRLWRVYYSEETLQMTLSRL